MVIASESYDSFARALQSEMAADVADRPRKVSISLFGAPFKDGTGRMRQSVRKSGSDRL